MNDIDLVLESFEGTYRISNKLSCLILGSMISDIPVLHQSNNISKEKINNEDMYSTVGAVKVKYLLSLSP